MRKKGKRLEEINLNKKNKTILIIIFIVIILFIIIIINFVNSIYKEYSKNKDVYDILYDELDSAVEKYEKKYMSDAKLSSIKKSYITLKDLSKKVELTYLSEQTSNECKGYVVI